MNIIRYYASLIPNKLKPNKVLVLLGARRVGKTQLIKMIMSNLQEKTLLLNGDDLSTHQLFAQQTSENFNRIFGNIQLLIIDEAQEIPNIGKKLKLLVDSVPNIKVLISGSSAFEINNQVGEPLVGRMETYQLYPIAQLELFKHENYLQTLNNLEERLVYGSYPELFHITDFHEKEKYLRELISNQLLRDIFAFEGIKKRDKIISLLQIVAYRVGSEVSLESIGKDLQISKNTVEKYLDLFSKVFIIYSVSGFSKKRDNENTKKKKWYFFDNGLRNAIINDFRSLSSRNDVGMLWENYLNSERKKLLEYHEHTVFDFFWRTHTNQEIDRIETLNDDINAYEFKWTKDKSKIPSEFLNAYPDAQFTFINKENYLDFIT